MLWKFTVYAQKIDHKNPDLQVGHRLLEYSIFTWFSLPETSILEYYECYFDVLHRFTVQVFYDPCTNRELKTIYLCD